MKKIFDQQNERAEFYSSNKFEYKDECLEDSEEAEKLTQILRIHTTALQPMFGRRRAKLVFSELPPYEDF